MTGFLLAVHILVCLFLIVVVLVQGGKGAELGSAFGSGASQTLFGPRGAATVLTKITTIMAVVFMITSLGLTIISAKRPSVVKAPPVTTKKEKAPLPSTEGAGVKPKTPSEKKTPEKK
jgi:preprotein translocase subunit SecG